MDHAWYKSSEMEVQKLFTKLLQSAENFERGGRGWQWTARSDCWMSLSKSVRLTGMSKHATKSMELLNHHHLCKQVVAGAQSSFLVKSLIEPHTSIVRYKTTAETQKKDLVAPSNCEIKASEWWPQLKVLMRKEPQKSHKKLLMLLVWCGTQATNSHSISYKTLQCMYLLTPFAN